MKKLCLLVFSCTILYTVPCQAQKFVAGLVGGITATQVSGDNLAGFNKPGLGIGGLLSAKLSEKFSAQFELLYMQKGSKSTATDSLVYFLTLHYLEIPVLLGYHYKKFVFEAGPSVAFLFGSTEEDAYGELKGAKPFDKVEVSANIGVTYPLSRSLMLNWRYGGSLTPIRAHASEETYGLNKGQYNSMLFFSLRYYFLPTPAAQ